jgi:SAM-dependent methyltransferase
MSIEKLKKEILQWDVETWFKALQYWEKKMSLFNVENALEIGGRDGGVSLWLATRGISVICSDIIDCSDSAFNLHSKFDYSGSITYSIIDARTLYQENYFDLIIFKSVIGGVGYNNDFEAQKIAFENIHRALKPGGILLFAENLRASILHRFFRSLFISWGNKWRYIDTNEINLFLSVFNYREINYTGFLAAFGRNENQRRIFAKVDNSVFNRLLPHRWKYVCFGIAVK